MPPRLPMINSKTMTDLTGIAHLHGPTNLCPPFSLHKPSSIFSTLETAFAILVCCLLSLHLRDKSLSCFTALSLCLWMLIEVSGWTWSAWDPWNRLLLPPQALATVPGAAASVSPENLLWMYILGSHCRLPNQNAGWGLEGCVSTCPLDDSCTSTL